jgi:hypothetical protein
MKQHPEHTLLAAWPHTRPGLPPHSTHHSLPGPGRGRACSPETAMRSRYGQLPEATSVDDTESTPAKGHSAAADIVESALPGQELSSFEDMHLLRKMLHMLWVGRIAAAHT